MSAIVTSETFRLFVNTLTPDDKCFRRNQQILWQQLQTSLSQKGKSFLIFYSISEMCMKFRTFWKKEEYPSLIITKIIGSERDVYLSV